MFDNRLAQLQATQIKCLMICRLIIQKRRSDHTAHACSVARRSHACGVKLTWALHVCTVYLIIAWKRSSREEVERSRLIGG